MFLTNIFRKKLYKKNFSLGDDFERTNNIFNQGYEIVFFNDKKMPRMIATYNRMGIKDLFKQKVRTAIAREQIKEAQKTNFFNYYLPSVWHIFRNGWKKGLKVGFFVSSWILLTTVATFVSKFKKMGTKEGWKLRQKR